MIFKNIDEIIKFIKKNKPKVIFLTSKSGNGKSYMSNKLSQQYTILELDLIIRKLGKKYKLGEAPDYNLAFKIYKNKLPKNIVNDFVKQIRTFIKKHNNVIIEGAISSPELLKKIFKDINYSFIYLYPTSIERYYERLMKRYIKDIKNKTKTLPFWNKIPEKINKKFMKNIAKEMKNQSIERYKMFNNTGFNILRVNV